MKQKIITEDDVVGWYYKFDTIAPKQFKDLTEEEKEDYLTEDDERDYIYVRLSDYSKDVVELFYDKNKLLIHLSEEADEKIERSKKEIIYQENLISKLIKNKNMYNSLRSDL